MVFIAIAAAVFGLDFGIKKFVEKKYQRKVRHPKLHNTIVIEKYYNNGAALNLLAKRPKVMRVLHTIVMLAVLFVDGMLLKTPDKTWTKTGLALLTGGGLNNLYDRYTKEHVVDYIRFNIGPKWFRDIIFNVSDFFVFLGAIFVVAGSDAV